jgi:hypothetical protein
MTMRLTIIRWFAQSVFCILTCSFNLVAKSTEYPMQWAPNPQAVDIESAAAHVYHELGENTIGEAEGNEGGDEGGDEIETDRDSFTPATTTAGRGRLIMESAYTFIDNRGRKESHSLPELLFRYGLSERFEFRLGWNYEIAGAPGGVSGGHGGAGAHSGENELERESNIAYGIKYRITDPSSWLPESAVILHGFSPTSG